MKKGVFTSNLSSISATIDGTEGFKKYSDKMPKMPENSGKRCQKFQNNRWLIEFQFSRCDPRVSGSPSLL